MYVDDAGTLSVKDRNFYVISGVIIEDIDLFFIERKGEDYRKLFFVRPYTDEEIHVHDIYHSEGNFGILSLADKYSLLNGLDKMFDSLPITVVSVGIDKIKSRGQYPNWNILNAAWTFFLFTYLGNALRRILIFFRVINAIPTIGRLIPKTMTPTGIMNVFRASLIK